MIPNPDLLQELQDVLFEGVKRFLPILIEAIIIFIVGRYAIRFIMRFVNKAIRRYSLDPTLGNFTARFIHVALNIVLIVSVISTLGVQTSSLVAMLGATSLAVGLALQGSLSNFAGGVLILFLKPFKVGDTITSKGISGSVIELSLFYTVIKTFSGQRVTIPNGQVSNDSITNFSVFEHRRIEMDIYVSSQHPISQIKPIFQSVLEAESRVLENPSLMITIENANEYRVHYKLKAWVLIQDYIPVINDLHEAIQLKVKSEFIQLSSPVQLP